MNETEKLGKYWIFIMTVSIDLKVFESHKNKKVNKFSEAEFSAADLLFRFNSDTKNQSTCANVGACAFFNSLLCNQMAPRISVGLWLSVSFVIRNIEKY